MKGFNNKLGIYLLQFSDILCTEKELVEKMIYINNNIHIGASLSDEDLKIVNKILHCSILLSLLIDKNTTEFEKLTDFLTQ